jgi:hypothetical protein
LEALERFTHLEELELSEYVSHEGAFEVVPKACPRLKHRRYTHEERYDEPCCLCNDESEDDREAMGIATMHELRSLRLVYSQITNKSAGGHPRQLLSPGVSRSAQLDNALRAKCGQINTKVQLMNDSANEYEQRPATEVLYPVSECSPCHD